MSLGRREPSAQREGLGGKRHGRLGLQFCGRPALGGSGSIWSTFNRSVLALIDRTSTSILSPANPRASGPSTNSSSTVVVMPSTKRVFPCRQSRPWSAHRVVLMTLCSSFPQNAACNSTRPPFTMQRPANAGRPWLRAPLQITSTTHHRDRCLATPPLPIACPHLGFSQGGYELRVQNVFEGRSSTGCRSLTGRRSSHRILPLRGGAPTLSSVRLSCGCPAAFRRVSVSARRNIRCMS